VNGCISFFLIPEWSSEVKHNAANVLKYAKVPQLFISIMQYHSEDLINDGTSFDLTSNSIS